MDAGREGEGDTSRQVLGGRFSKICGSWEGGQCQTSIDPGREGE